MNVKEIPFLFSVARASAERSKANRAKVGAVAADSNGRIIATGYNGTHSGADNTCEERIYTSMSVNDPFISEYPLYDQDRRQFYKLVTLPTVIHAEANIIAQSAKRGLTLEGATVFGTLSPCLSCASLLIQSGVKEMWFLEKYRNHDEVEEKMGRYLKMRHYCDNSVL